MAPEPISLLDLDRPRMARLMDSWGQPPFRAEQIWHWVYVDLAEDADRMTNLPEACRARIRAETSLRPLEILTEQVSGDQRTRKVLFGLHDGSSIESVLMCYDRRQTACISVQAGCGMGCSFCATGQGGLQRNLSTGEIVAQVLHFARHLRGPKPLLETGVSGSSRPSAGPLTNVVLMGMGEPLANYDATWHAIETLSDPRGFGLGARRITLSTVGLVPGIRRLARERIAVNLAVSLHAADDQLRSQLVPVNRHFPLPQLMEAVLDYINVTSRRVSFEYALISGVNDAAEHARQLGALLRRTLCHVNLIPLNPTPGSPLQPSSREQVGLFRDSLESAGIPVTVRMRRGSEIQAGCGQLRERHLLADSSSAA